MFEYYLKLLVLCKNHYLFLGRKNFNPNELYSLVVDIKEVPDSIEEAKAEQDSLFDGSFGNL